MTVVSLMPCYVRAQAGIAAKGPGDTLMARYLTTPATFSLTLGVAVNSVAASFLAKVQKETKQDLNLNFIAQLVYFIFIANAVTFLTAQWGKWSALLKEEAKEEQKAGSQEEDEDDGYSALSRLGVEIEMVSGQIFVSSIAFVYALAMKSTLNNFFFDLMMGCGGKCTYRENFLYAAIVTVISVKIVTMLTEQQRNKAWGKANQSLQILALSLNTGWGWVGYFNATVSALLQKAGADGARGAEALCHVVLLLAFTIGATLWYHAFLTEKRRWKIQRDLKVEATRAKV